MENKTLFFLLIIFALTFSVIGIKKSYYNYYKNSGPISARILYSKLAGIIVSIILVLLYLLGYIEF